MRLISALALLTTAFAHVPAVSGAADSADLSAYAFPDGSMPVFCISGKVDADDPFAAANPCEYCRLSGSMVAAEPVCGVDALFRLAQPVKQFPCPGVDPVTTAYIASKPLRGPPQV